MYTTLGFGFFESIYANALEHELKARGHRVAREVRVQVVYKGHVVGIQSVDQIVDEKLIVETKSSHDLPRGAARQVPSYLKATHLNVGLLLHFGPVPKFYRYVSRGTTTNPTNPTNPKQ